MILTAILNFFYNGIVFILGYFINKPDVAANTGFAGAIALASTYYAALAAFMPFVSIIVVLAFDLTFEGIYFVYKMIRWAYQKIPMIN